MGDEYDRLPPGPEEVDHPLLEYSGVLHLVEEEDRRRRDHDRIGHEERPGLPAGESGHPGIGPDRLARKLVCKGDRLADDIPVLDLSGPDVHRKELRDREIGEAPGVLGDQGDGFVRRVADELLGRVGTVDEDRASRRGVVLGKNLDVVDEGALPRAGGADDRDCIAGPDGDRPEPFRLAAPAPAGEDRDLPDGCGVHGITVVADCNKCFPVMR